MVRACSLQLMLLVENLCRTTAQKGSTSMCSAKSLDSIKGRFTPEELTRPCCCRKARAAVISALVKRLETAATTSCSAMPACSNSMLNTLSPLLFNKPA